MCHGPRLVLALAAALAACGESVPEPASTVRLWIDGRAELTSGPPPPPARLLYSSDFAHELETWRPIVNPGREGDGPVAHAPLRDGRVVLELNGAHGGLHRVFEVEPDTCYVFAGEVRSDGVVSDLEHSDGARFWLAEASGRTDSFAEFRTTASALMTADWPSPSATDGAGWSPIRRLFVTRSKTRYLHVVCALATRATLRSGSVQFADLRLEQHPRASYWADRLARECAQRTVTDPPAAGQQGERLIAAELGGVSRPSLVLLPGERLRIPLEELTTEVRLSFAAAPWPADVLPHRGQDPRASAQMARLEVRVDGDVAFERGYAPARRPEETRWDPGELALPDGARALEFVSTGPLPLAIGTPLLAGPPPARAGPNLILVSVDTLRADHVGPPGAPSSLTPHLDRLAEAGLRCLDMSAAAPYTLPSHATLFTGQFPSVHGVVAHESKLSSARSLTLAERLAHAGYATQAFTASGFVHPAFGLDQGFESFALTDPIRAEGSHYFRTLAQRLGEEEARHRLREQGFAGVEHWLRARDGRPFFLFLHTYAVHDYDAPREALPCDALGCARPRVEIRTETAEDAARFTPEMRAHVRHLYGAALRHTDERLGRLFELLEELGLADSTLVAVTSDHGEEFFEHGLLQHGHTLYEEMLRVPFILRGPGVAPGLETRAAMAVDVLPTLLARLGLPPLPNVQGVDLLGPAWPARAVWSEVDSRFARKYALREEGGLKTIHGPETKNRQRPNERTFEQYELAQDPQEEHDLSAHERAELLEARTRLERHRALLQELGAALGTAGEGELREETLQELEGLGYGGE